MGDVRFEGEASLEKVVETQRITVVPDKGGVAKMADQGERIAADLGIDGLDRIDLQGESRDAGVELDQIAGAVVGVEVVVSQPGSALDRPGIERLVVIQSDRRSDQVGIRVPIEEELVTC